MYKFIRITADNDEAIQQLCEDIPSYVCKEGPDNEKHCRKTHYHLLMQNDLTDNGLRKRIYNYFNVPSTDRGQQFCAFTQVKDEEGVKRYISKGLENVKPEIILNSLEVNVDKYYNDYWSTFTSLKQTRANEKEISKSRTQEFIDYFDSNYNTATKHTRATLTLGKVCDLMVAYYRDKDYLMPTKWQGSQLVRTLYVKYSTNENVKVNMRRFYDAEEW